MSAINLTNENFDSVFNSDKKVLIDFYADWCGPCRIVTPLVDQIADENPQYFVCKVNVTEQPAITEHFGVGSIPTIIIMKNGEVLNKSVGARSKLQILSMFED